MQKVYLGAGNVKERGMCADRYVKGTTEDKRRVAEEKIYKEGVPPWTHPS